MRILQINSVCGVGSTGRIATDIHQLLIEQGHESYIGYGRGEAHNCETAIKIGNKYDNYAHALITRTTDKHGFASKNVTKQFIKKIEELDPDVIHLHNIHGYYINIKLLFDYLKTANKPVVWTLHDCWAFTGHCAYFDYVGCDKWKVGCNNCPEKSSYPSSSFIDNSRDNYINKKDIFNGVENLKIVTPSKWLSGLVKESFLSKYPVEVINNGIDVNIFQPTKSNIRKKYNIEKEYIILGVASMWDRRKGLKYFIELSSKLNDNEVIVLVGLSEKQKEQLPKKIIGITRTNNIKELVDIYSAADVYVNPTLEDNFPTTNLEALACGTPVITFDTGGSGEPIENNTGFVVEKGDIAALVKRINQVKNERNNYKTDCVKRVLDHYEKESKYRDYILLYEDFFS
ncbi:glycosyltransferase family 4 protein [Neobacillus rhizosphaerae]|uniref:glycosyltransferase family 4 protein n=1 Tax=Neobacillus rhizosphaerae TaxID=2880965 RepID=UPI003D2AB7A9